MKILHINTMISGGAAKACIRLHENLLKQGVESHILFLEKGILESKNIHFYPGEKISLWKRFLYKIGIQKQWWQVSTSRLENIQLQQYPFTFPDVDIHLEDLTILESFDIIHLHWVSNFVNYQRFFPKVRKPIVWTLHDMNPFTGGCHYAMNCENYIKDCHFCPQIIGIKNPGYSNLNWRIKNRSYKNINLSIVSLSNWMSEKAKKSSLFSTFNHFTIPNSIETDKFFERHSKDKKVKIIGYVSSYITLGKGYDILLEAWEKLVVDQNFVKLQYIGSELPINNQNEILYKGRLNSLIDLAEFYNEIDLLILPSREDNLPNVMLEAWACGTPILAFDTGGMKDFIIDGFNGLLAGKPGTDNLVACLNEYLYGNIKFDHSRIREFALNTFNGNRQAIEYISLYQNILNEKYVAEN